MRTAAVSIVVAGLALPAVACGSSPGSHVAQLGSANSQLLAFSKCMRSHGEPTFPDPNAQGQIKQQLRASGINMNSSRYQAAEAACHSKLPNGGGGMTPAQFQQMKVEAVRFSGCIQAHGFPNYPDPGSDGREPDPASVGIDEDSPQWQAAHRACFRP
jgi:hypothetical protein